MAAFKYREKKKRQSVADLLQICKAPIRKQRRRGRQWGEEDDV